MLPLFAPKLNQQIGLAVHYLGHIDESRRHIHIAEHFDDTFNTIQVAQRRLHNREMVERAVARRFVGLFKRHRIAHLAAILELAVDAADISADEKQVADAHEADIIRCRHRWIGQLVAELM
jgi:hypothetical protein